MMVGEHRREP